MIKKKKNWRGNGDSAENFSSNSGLCVCMRVDVCVGKTKDKKKDEHEIRVEY